MYLKTGIIAIVLQREINFYLVAYLTVFSTGSVFLWFELFICIAFKVVVESRICL